MPTFIWRDYGCGYEDEGFIVVNARNEEEAREKFWADYKRTFEEWWEWYDAWIKKENKKYKGRSRNQRKKSVAWTEWKKQAETVDGPPAKILFDDEVYYYALENGGEGGTGINRYEKEREI